MKNLRHWAAAASILTVALCMGTAAAADPASENAASDEIANVGDAAALGTDELGETSGGFAIQTGVNEQTAAVANDHVTVVGDGQVNTGGVVSLSANSGGINSTLLNTGNNVSFQNSTVLNLYLQ